MTEHEAIDIIESGLVPYSTLLHAARFILGVHKEQQRIYARMETIIHESAKVEENYVLTNAERIALVCDACGIANAYNCGKCNESQS